MYTATITSNGLVTIPKEIREKLNIKPGDIVTLEVEDQNKIIIHIKKRKAEEAFGMLHRENGISYSTEEMDAKVAEFFKNNIKRP